MFIKQLTVFIENREGRLEEVLEMLKKNDINIVSLSLADTSDYGLLRLIVAEPEKAREALKNNGFSAMLTDVFAVKIAHQVGQLQELLSVICNAHINVEYMYALATSDEDASMIIKTSDVEKVKTIIEENGIDSLSMDDIKSL